VPWASLGKRLEWSVLCRTLYRVKQPQRRGGGGLGFSDYNTYSISNLLYKNGMTQGHMFVAKRSRISHDVVVA
jgi:hypothetical protein